MTESHWWLESGPETCQFCLRAFNYEAGFHCIYCDSPICPVCVETHFATRTTRCPECHADKATDQEEA